MLTKKQIRNQLSPMSMAIRSGADFAVTELLDMKVECSRLYNARGCAGFAWHPHFTAYRDGKVMTGGNLSEIVDRLALIQTKDVADGCRVIWERVKRNIDGCQA